MYRGYQQTTRGEGGHTTGRLNLFVTPIPSVLIFLSLLSLFTHRL
jgi:hypothetical protein